MEQAAVMEAVKEPAKKLIEVPIKEAPLPAKSAIAWQFGTAANQLQMPQPNMVFYWDMPADAPCVLSLHGSVTAPRTYGRLDVPPRRHLLWPDDQVRAASTVIRCLHGEETKSIVRPRIWEDLYQYFDAVDLWTRGAWNLWRVLHLMCDENEAKPPPSHLDPWYAYEVMGWACNWCTNPENREKLRAWNRKSDILTLMSAEDRKNLKEAPSQALAILRFQLSKSYDEFKEKDSSPVDIIGKHTGNDEGDNGRNVQLPSPIRTMDDNSILDTWESAGALAGLPVPFQGRARRHSTSLPTGSSRATKTEVTEKPFVYKANPAIVVVNGTNYDKSSRPKFSLEAYMAEKKAGKKTQQADINTAWKGHQPSKSSSVPVIPASYPVIPGGAGVYGPGPSCLPANPRQTSVMSATAVPFSPQMASQQHMPHAAPSGSPSKLDTPYRRATDQVRTHQNHNPRFPCRNSHINAGIPRGPFQVCHCDRCERQTRSIHISQIALSVSTTEAEKTLVNYFSRWGYVQSCEVKRSNNRYHHALVRFASTEGPPAAIKGVSEGPEIARHPILAGATINHASFSRHIAQQPKTRRESDVSRPSSGSGSSGQNTSGRASRDERAETRQSPFTPRRPPRMTPSRLSHQGSARSNRFYTATPPHLRAQSMAYPMSWDHASPSQNNFMGPPPGPVHWGGPFPMGGWPGMHRPMMPPPPFPPAQLPAPGHYHPSLSSPHKGTQGFRPPPENLHTSPTRPGVTPPVSMPAREPQATPASTESVMMTPTAVHDSVHDDSNISHDTYPLKSPAQTKPSADESIFNSARKVSSSITGNSQTGTTIRVRLPTMTEATQVLFPVNSAIAVNSPVRRITFGDFVTQDNGSLAATPAVTPINKSVSTAADSPITVKPVPSPARASSDLIADGGERRATPPQNASDDRAPDAGTASHVGSDENRTPPEQDAFSWQFDQIASRRISGDVRLEPDFTGTVVRRRPRPQHGRVPWTAGGERRDSHGSRGSRGSNGFSGSGLGGARRSAGGGRFPSPPQGQPVGGAEGQGQWFPPHGPLPPQQQPWGWNGHGVPMSVPMGPVPIHRRWPPEVFPGYGLPGEGGQQMPFGGERPKGRNPNNGRNGNRGESRPVMPDVQAAVVIANGDGGHNQGPRTEVAAPQQDAPADDGVTAPATPVTTSSVTVGRETTSWDDIYNASPPRERNDREETWEQAAAEPQREERSAGVSLDETHSLDRRQEQDDTKDGMGHDDKPKRRKSKKKKKKGKTAELKPIEPVPGSAPAYEAAPAPVSASVTSDRAVT
ncbi:hypothetical protein VTJ49DRAFT_5447 [Mycothermus thermophilus]|uniref:RRM domain-containing protein n=1 Tax=Humicola insolens TaxID=85995 RepID=A0ABR3V3P0_HUMIN